MHTTWKDVVVFAVTLAAIVLTHVAGFALGIWDTDESDFSDMVLLASMLTVCSAVREQRDA